MYIVENERKKFLWEINVENDIQNNGAKGN